MGFGSATKKIQKVADMAEELYARMNELGEQILEMRETLQETHNRVAALENKIDQQQALLEALAAEQGIDVDRQLTRVAIDEAEGETSDSADGSETTETTTEELIENADETATSEAVSGDASQPDDR
ncbi:MAG: DUF5798 family protein [Natronomonas sp.]